MGTVCRSGRVNKSYLSGVFETLKGAAPRLPLYLSDRAPDGTQFPFYLRWEKGDAVPIAESGGDEAKTRAMRRRRGRARPDIPPSRFL